MTLNIASPFTGIQEHCRTLRKAILEQGKEVYVVSKTDRGYCEVGVQIKGEMDIFYGRESIGISVIESLDTAELKALQAVCDYLKIEVQYTGVKPKPSPNKVFSDWNAVRVSSYKRVEDLLRDMESDKFDMTEILAYRDELISKNQRLTPNKVAQKFFRKSHKTVAVVPTQDDIQPERLKEVNPEWAATFKQLSTAGWNDEKIKESFGKTFSGLLDFCKFATPTTVDKCR